MNKTIKTYTELTPADAGELLHAAGGKPVDGIAFRDSDPTESWFIGPLKGVLLERYNAFRCESWWPTAATVTEIDPCQSPEGCPELEPWMAYVGVDLRAGDFPLMRHAGKEVWFSSNVRKFKLWQNGFSLVGGGHIAIDVTTAWALDNFPEHCRIRNYKKPDAFEEWWLMQEYVSVALEPNLLWKCRAAYELGQSHPTEHKPNE